MRKRAWVIGVVALLVVGLLVAGCGGQAQKPKQEAEQKPITLKYAFFAPANTFPAVQMQKWAEEVQKRTNGKVKVDTFPGGTLLTAQNMFDGVLRGVADIGLSCPSYEPGRFPLVSITDMPAGFPNAKVASVTFWDLVKEFQAKEPGLADFKVIAAFSTEPAYIQSKKPASKLEDLKALRLRTAGTGVAVMKALGGTPVGMPQSEVAQALQTGVVDGYVSSRECLYDFKYAESCKYWTDYPLFQVTFLALMNKNVWNSLPPDVQKVIDDLGREISMFAGDYLDQHCKKSVDWAVKEHGLKAVTLSAQERARWDEKIKGLVDQAVKDAEAKGLPGKQYLQRLYELRDQNSKS